MSAPRKGRSVGQKRTRRLGTLRRMKGRAEQELVTANSRRAHWLDAEVKALAWALDELVDASITYPDDEVSP